MTNDQKEILRKFVKNFSLETINIAEYNLMEFIEGEERFEKALKEDAERMDALSANIKSYRDRIEELDNLEPGTDDPRKFDKVCGLCGVFKYESGRSTNCGICPLGPEAYACMKRGTNGYLGNDWFSATRSQLKNRMHWLLDKYASKGYMLKGFKWGAE